MCAKQDWSWQLVWGQQETKKQYYIVTSPLISVDGLAKMCASDPSSDE